MRCKNLLLAATIVCAAILGGCSDDSTTQPTQTVSTEPTNHPTNFKAVSGTDSSITLSWTDATGEILPENYIILAAEFPVTPERPIDSIQPVPGLLAKIIAKSIQKVTFTGLKENQQYNFAIFPFTGSGEKTNYKTTGALTIATGKTFKKVPPSYIFPLKIGNRWNYKTFYIDYAAGTTTDANKDYTTEVLTDTTIAGSVWYKVINFSTDNGSIAVIQNRGDGLWRKTAAFEYLVYKYPAQLNSVFMSAGAEKKVVAIAETINVEKGTFDCYNYSDNTDSALQENEYLAPDIGIIKLLANVTDATGNFGISKELQDFILK